LTWLTGQQIPVDPDLAQLPLWHSWLFVHEPPLAVSARQLPLPSQTWLVPQGTPACAFIWLHTDVPFMHA
jgi:hypothetical protein